jgi:predicted GNAT family acetyltransferase
LEEQPEKMAYYSILRQIKDRITDKEWLDKCTDDPTLTSNQINHLLNKIEMLKDVDWLSKYKMNTKVMKDKQTFLQQLEVVRKWGNIDSQTYWLCWDGIVVCRATVHRKDYKTKEISNVYTRPLYRRRGCCKYLLQYILNKYPEHDFEL